MADAGDSEQDAPGASNRTDIPSEDSSPNGEMVSSIPKNASPEPRAKSGSPNTSDITSRLLYILSTASSETLVGIAIGLAVCTYLFLGRIGLLLIGILGGIVIHATWEGQNPTEEYLRRERGLDIAKRLLDWRQTRTESKARVEEDLFGEYSPYANDFDDFPPNTTAALTELVDTIVRDYVNWWYDPILPAEQSFPMACRQILTAFIRSVSAHLSRKRPADTFLDFLTNTSSIVIVFLNELSNALSASQGLGASPEDAVRDYLQSNPESNLSNILNQNQQKKKFNIISEDILQNFLDRKGYDCDPLRIFLREILAGVILEMTLKSFSKPEWINGWIVYALEGSEPELIQAIDEGMNMASRDTPTGTLPNNEQLNPTRAEEVNSQKRFSKAEDAMEQAMKEAKMLTELMAEEDAKRSEAMLDRTDIHEGVEDGIEPLNGEVARTSLYSPIHEALKDPDPGLFPIESHSTESEHKEITHESTSTNLDRAPPQQPNFQMESQQDHKSPMSFTLHNASINILDDSAANDIGRLRSKPTGDYLVQIEPQSSQHPGWMIVRKYTDFENLHEILRRIATISGVADFTEQHNFLPGWRNNNKPSLRGELECYLRDACRYQLLAESEGMKRFLEKEQSLNASGKGSFPGIGWPSPSAFENMGKGMLDVLANAPKGAAESGKVVLGGVTGVLGNIGSRAQRKKGSTSSPGPLATEQSHIPSNFGRESRSSISESPSREVDGEFSILPTAKVETTVENAIGWDARYSSKPDNNSNSDLAVEKLVNKTSGPLPVENAGMIRTEHFNDLSQASQSDLDDILLPPPPSEISDDYGSQNSVSAKGVSGTDSITTATRSSVSSEPPLQSPGRLSTSNHANFGVPKTKPARKLPYKEAEPLTQEETCVAVELLFAIINELYMLSSAWTIRRTLLTAAKTFLLRPGNPSLLSIQNLMQDSVIMANISDEGIASHIRKLRASSMPTEDELKAWPPELTIEEKEKLRIKARKLLLEKGMPPALIGVMGQAATSEALGRVFDCLQIEEVTRGLMFGILLQGVRAVTQ